MTIANPLWLIGAVLLFSLIPLALALFTSYLKVSVVLGMLRSALGAQNVPGALVVMVLSLAITLQIMTPVGSRMLSVLSTIEFSRMEKMVLAEKLEVLSQVSQPLREFMLKHAGKRELSVLSQTVAEPQHEAPPPAEGMNDPARIPFAVLASAFVLSELKQGFVMGFVLLLPFLVIDLVVSNILAGMGMYMVSPMIIALPLKLILFVMADGWLLLARGLVASYAG